VYFQGEGKSSGRERATTGKNVTGENSLVVLGKKGSLKIGEIKDPLRVMSMKRRNDIGLEKGGKDLDGKPHHNTARESISGGKDLVLKRTAATVNGFKKQI